MNALWWNKIRSNIKKTVTETEPPKGLSSLELSNWYYDRKQYSKSFKLALKAANGTSDDTTPRAMLCVGIMYARGYGTLRNYNRAYEWLERAVKHNENEAKCYLAELYANEPYASGVNLKKAKKLATEGYNESKNPDDCYCRSVWENHKLYNM